MSHFFDSKRWKFFLSCMGLIALALLAIGLRDFNFKPAQPVEVGSRQETDSGLPPSALPLDRVIIVITILTFFFIVLFLVPRETRKWVLLIFSCFIALVFTLYLISNASRAKVIFDLIPGINNQLVPTPADLTPQVSQPPAEFQQPAEFHPPQVSNFILYLVSFALTMLLTFVVWMIYRWRQPLPLDVTFNSLEEIGEAARLALDDLAAGLDGKDAVILCYARMSEVVMQKRSLQRGASRTAAEFATRLEAAGLPGTSVRRLTRLFESARYSVRESQPLEVEEAKACLTDIAQYCGETI
jgi:hypothetical protein